MHETDEPDPLEEAHGEHLDMLLRCSPLGDLAEMCEGNRFDIREIQRRTVGPELRAKLLKKLDNEKQHRQTRG